MGGAQSTNTRKLTIPNEDPTGVLEISDSVIERMRGGREGKEEKPESPPVSQLHSPVRQVTSSLPHYYHGRGTPKTSLEIQQDKQEALKENDEYWAKRVRIMEDNHMKINQRMEDEYKKAVKEVEELFARLPSKEEQPPCSYAGQYVMKCYQQNPKEVLKCAREVEAFAACVDMKRVNLLHSRQNIP
ncbi:hypothetical protein L9F63_021167 [Diploptera punctata]|uniref:MICOS complex subunit MIC19 n=1 Tax=Diploptera punctata TaxID=6984 RepID=A0AAD8EBR0_DIPPU|nr:hypothetical protein L9F63_021167 [Diploptera punctata]